MQATMDGQDTAIFHADEGTYFVIPLSVQKEDDNYYIGNAQLDEFYQFPEEGLGIIRMLQQRQSIGMIKSNLLEQGESIDVDEFVDTLIEIGFIYPDADKDKFQEAVLAVESGENRVIFKANQNFASKVFSLPTLVIYLGVIGYAAYSAALDPKLRLDFGAFYLEKNLTLTLFVLLALYAITASLHELAHMLAAARQGVNSKLGFSNRLWNIVAEADMTGLLSVPRNKRYLPLCAGMMVDVLSISIVTLMLKWTYAHDTNHFVIQLLHVLALQVTISIFWQFSIFVRTDVYYVVCNLFGYTNLNEQARNFFEHQLHTYTLGLLGKHSQAIRPEHAVIARTFFAIWLLGRIWSVVFLFYIVLPTIYRYFLRAQESYYNPYMPISATIDLAIFATISAAIVGAGLYMWIKPKKNS
jgi:putative peptide zinc metalloprotease protein